MTYRTYLDWFLLCFLAGNVNAGGYMSCHRFVSHVTGFGTLTGIAFDEKGILEGIAVLTIPGFFLAGVMLSAYLTERKFVKKAHGQKYAPVMGLVAILLSCVTVFGQLNFFGAFGAPAVLQHDYILMALLCSACGLQNAAVTSASGATVRTTHLTGLTTDLGIGLVRAGVRDLSAEQKEKERRANWLRIGMIASFILGSGIGAFLFARFQYLGFCLPVVLAIYASLTTSRSEKSSETTH